MIRRALCRVGWHRWRVHGFWRHCQRPACDRWQCRIPDLYGHPSAEWWDV